MHYLCIILLKMEPVLIGKRILIGISGSVAAYKVPELIRLIKKSGAEVKTVLTDGALQFVTPTTLQAVSGSDVYFGKQSFEQETKMTHISLARWADVIIIAPASANLIARLAHGFADDLLTTICLATKSPVVIAPAMNVGMWGNSVTQKNLGELRERYFLIWGPASGEQACGEEGEGRMQEPGSLFENLKTYLLKSNKKAILSGKKIVITAGPTIEPIDPVRFLSNHSTGRMGYALAKTAVQYGARVVLISGPTNIEAPVNAIRVQTAAEMLEQVVKEVKDADVFISCAAVADYRVKNLSLEKIKKSDKACTLELEPNADIVSKVANIKNKPYIVGFAAETTDLIANARAKLERKKLDMIVANAVGINEGFGDVENSITLISRNRDPVFIPSNNKEALAESIIKFMCAQLDLEGRVEGGTGFEREL